MKHLAKFLALGSMFAAASPLALAGTIPAPVTIAFSNYNPLPSGNTDPLDDWTNSSGVQTDYTESGFTVSQVSGTNYLNANQGDTPPGISAAGASIFSVAPSTAGEAFELSSFVVAAGTSANFTYTIEGFAGSTEVWSYTGTALESTASNSACPAGYARSASYCYETITLPSADETGVASVDFVTTSGQSGTFDDIALAPTPEPGSLLLLGTGLAGACGILYRRRRAATV